MAYKTKNGIILRTPAEKGKRYARQMRRGVIAETGEKLDKVQMAYRAGYLDARSDSAKAYNHNRKKK